MATRLLVMLLCVLGCSSKSDERAEATKSTAHVPGPPPVSLALAVVFNGQEIAVGNDDFEPNENASYPGFLHALAAGLDRAATLLPPDAKATVIAYATGAWSVVPMGPIAAVSGRAIGGQKEYMGKIGTDMLQGLTLGIAELSKIRAQRKVLVLVGDGTDTNNEVAKQVLVQLAKAADMMRIERHALVTRSPISAEGQLIELFAPRPQFMQAQQLAAELEKLFTALATPPQTQRGP